MFLYSRLLSILFYFRFASVFVGVVAVAGIFYVVLSSDDERAMRNVLRTLDEGVPLDEVSRFMPKELIREIRRYHLDRVFAWGSRPTSRNLILWEDMERGDFFLVIIGGYVCYVAKIVWTLRSSELAKSFWGVCSDGSTWELIYILTMPIRIYVSIERIREMTNGVVVFSPRGLNRLSRERLESLKQQYGSIKNFISALILTSLHEPPAIQRIPMPSEEPTTPARPNHEELKRILVELGTLLDKISVSEENVDGGNIDVTWRRVRGGAPYIAFEIHLAGDIHADLAKLKYALEKWNCSIVLVTHENGKRQAERLIESIYRELRDRLKIIHWKEIIELRKLIKKLRQKHQEFDNILFRIC